MKKLRFTGVKSAEGSETPTPAPTVALKDHRRFLKMANVSVMVRVIPTSPDVDLDELLAKVKEKLGDVATLSRVEKEPIAFGLVALNLTLLVEEDPEKVDLIEERLGKIESVGSARVEAVSRSL